MIRKSMLGLFPLILMDEAPTDGGGGTTLNADQQKVANAVNKIAAATAPAATAEPPSETKVTQPKVHKIRFREPTAQELETKFDVDDEAPSDIKPDETTTTAGDDKKKTSATVAKVDATTTQKPAETAKTTADKGATKPTVASTTAIEVKAGAAKAFDYSGFTPEEVGVLKQMSNQAREFTAKQIRQVKELQTQAPALYYQHQDAYQLDPGYKELQQKAEYVSVEKDHWRQQLINIRAGKPWYILEGFDDKGQPMLKGPLKATDESDVDVSNALQAVTGEMGKLQQQRQTFGQQYSKQVQIDNGVLQAERERRFDWVKDPAKMEEKVPIEGMGEVPIKQIREDFKGLFARYHHGNPILEMAADMFVALQIYGGQIRALEGSASHQTRLAKDLQETEPSPDTANGGNAAGNKEFDMEGLPS